MRYPNEENDLGPRNKRLACGCILGLYSRPVEWCDKHYQQILDERFSDPNDILPSLAYRICNEPEHQRS